VSRILIHRAEAIRIGYAFGHTVNALRTPGLDAVSGHRAIVNGMADGHSDVSDRTMGRDPGVPTDSMLASYVKVLVVQLIVLAALLWLERAFTSS
jgi:hypothetical protein